MSRNSEVRYKFQGAHTHTHVQRQLLLPVADLGEGPGGQHPLILGEKKKKKKEKKKKNKTSKKGSSKREIFTME